eukprot:scaffold17778_cov78-Phaeocystis_antarctica.AAC.8
MLPCISYYVGPLSLLPQRVSHLSARSMRRVLAVLTCGGSIAQETPDVCHRELEPRTSRRQAGLLLTRLSLALDRRYASSRGYARPSTRSRPRPSSAGWR